MKKDVQERDANISILKEKIEKLKVDLKKEKNINVTRMVQLKEEERKYFEVERSSRLLAENKVKEDKI